MNNPLEKIARRQRFERQLEKQRMVMAEQGTAKQSLGVQDLLDETAAALFSPAFLTIAIVLYFIIH